MNRVLALAALGIVLMACGGRAPEVSKAESKGAVPPPAAHEVTLSPAAQKEAGVIAETVAVRSLSEVLRTTGRITVNEVRTWRVGAVTEGRIVKVYVNAGDPVTEGQILAHLYSQNVHEGRAAYRKALADLARLKSVLAYAQRVRDRARRLYELKAASLEQLEHAETELKNAQAAVLNAETDVARTRAHLVDFLGVSVGSAEVQKEGSAEDLIPIKSPAEGTLLQRHVTPGMVVQPSGELFLITDLSTLWMIAQVQEEHLSRVRTGMGVRVSVQAYPDRHFAGRIIKLDEELDQQTRTIRARVELPNQARLLKPEMYATAELALGATRRALFVPEQAIQEINGHAAVFVRKGESLFEVRPVERGQSVEGSLEITAGLREGDWVVTRAGFILKSQMLKGSLAEE